MPHSIEFDETRKRVTILVAPPVNLDDALTCFRTVRMDPRYSAEYRIFLNSWAADRAPTVEEGLEMASVLRAFFPGQKLAWLRHNPPKDHPGIEALQTASKVNVVIQQFSDPDAAQAWLDT